MSPRRRRQSIRRVASADVSTCKAGGCDAAILLLRHERTGNVAAIDLRPVPGGNIAVNRQAGTYAVLHPLKHPSAAPDPDAEQLTLADELEAPALEQAVPDDEDVPTLHLNHYVTCQNVTAIRLARQRERGH